MIGCGRPRLGLQEVVVQDVEGDDRDPDGREPDLRSDRRHDSARSREWRCRLCLSRLLHDVLSRGFDSELEISAGAARVVRPPLPRGHSYWSASRMFSFEARFAGRIAASMPARIATPTKTTSVP